jgi:murein DD-endopeptidase MepM/ murein hydrolase activator NlpD
MNRRSVLFAVALAAVAGLHHAPAHAQFAFRPPGELVTGSGRGRMDDMVYAPGIRFPIENAPAYLNSQVWGVGGSQGPSGSQCDGRNFSYPWRDNYCESRTWDMPMCPAGQGHQGQDIRAADCRNSVHNAVAVTDGMITSIGSYSVYLTAADGTRFDYLHMSDVAVRVGQSVRRGQVVGRVSNQFGGTPTTVHLHFNIRKTVTGFGSVYAPTYLSLVRAYESLLGGGPPAGPRFGAQFVMQSFPLATTTLDLPAGVEQRGYFEFRNTGSETWRPGEVFLATTQPRDRASMAQGSDWVRSSRAATVDRVVATGATGRFAFSLRAPMTVGRELREYFGLVREGVAWFSDPGQGGPADGVLQVRVRAVASGDAGAGRDAGEGPEAGLDGGEIADADAGQGAEAGGGAPDVEEPAAEDASLPGDARLAGDAGAAGDADRFGDEGLPRGCGCAVPGGGPRSPAVAIGAVMSGMVLLARRRGRRARS